MEDWEARAVRKRACIYILLKLAFLYIRLRVNTDTLHMIHKIRVSIGHGVRETPPTIHLMQLLPKKVAFDSSPTFGTFQSSERINLSIILAKNGTMKL